VTKEQAKKIFQDFEKLNILIIGDVMIDSYIWGNVERISPEAPVPVLSAVKKEYRLGGAANVALNIKALGANPVICSVIGKDNNGFSFEGILKKNDINRNYLVKDESRPTTIKTRAIAHQQQLIRIDEESTGYLSDETQDKLKQSIHRAIEKEKIAAIVIQDYNKGVLTPEIIKEVIKLSNDTHIPLLVDPKKQNFDLYGSLTLFKPNLRELKEGLKVEINKDDINGIIKLCKQTITEKNIQIILLTLSEKGIVICTRDESHHIAAIKRDISDVSGAGDTVVGTASLCLAAKMDIYEIALISNIAGGIVCEKVGVVPVDKERLMEELVI